jgi:hypothetical protein
MYLPETVERKHCGNPACCKADAVARVGSGLAELQKTTNNTEAGASCENGQVRAPDGTISASTQNAPQLYELFPLVVDFGYHGIYIERCRYHRVADPLAKR